MPRDPSGTYTLTVQNPVSPGTVIATGWANPTLNDIAAALTDSLDRYGRGGMLAPFYLEDGTVGAPGLSFDTEPNSGLYRAGTHDLRMTINGADVTRWSSGSFTIWNGTSWVRPGAQLDTANIWTALQTFNGGIRVATSADFDISIHLNQTLGLFVKDGAAVDLLAVYSPAAGSIGIGFLDTLTAMYFYTKTGVNLTHVNGSGTGATIWDGFNLPSPGNHSTPGTWTAVQTFSTSIVLGTDATDTTGFIDGPAASGYLEIRTHSGATNRGWMLGTKNNAGVRTGGLYYIEGAGDFVTSAHPFKVLTASGTVMLLGSTASQSMANPVRLDMGGSYGSNPVGNPANAKLMIHTGDYGFGVTDANFEAYSGGAFSWYVGGVERMRLTGAGALTVNGVPVGGAGTASNNVWTGVNQFHPTSTTGNPFEVNLNGAGTAAFNLAGGTFLVNSGTAIALDATMITLRGKDQTSTLVWGNLSGAGRALMAVSGSGWGFGDTRSSFRALSVSNPTWYNGTSDVPMAAMVGFAKVAADGTVIAGRAVTVTHLGVGQYTITHGAGVAGFVVLPVAMTRQAGASVAVVSETADDMLVETTVGGVLTDAGFTILLINQ
jgi:hypothetical protein